jgi:hypothetical protein
MVIGLTVVTCASIAGSSRSETVLHPTLQ